MRMSPTPWRCLPSSRFLPSARDTIFPCRMSPLWLDEFDSERDFTIRRRHCSAVTCSHSAGSAPWFSTTPHPALPAGEDQLSEDYANWSDSHRSLNTASMALTILPRMLIPLHGTHCSNTSALNLTFVFLGSFWRHMFTIIIIIIIIISIFV